MPRPSRFDRVNRPSPLQEVQYARPLSTLSSLHHTPENAGGDPRRLSVLPEQMAPGDAEFWQRFDVASRSEGMDEESIRKLEERDRVMDEDLERSMERSPSRRRSAGMEIGREGTPSTQESDRKAKNEYLEKQRKKRRRAHMMGLGLVLSICAIIVIVAVLGWYFGRPSENRSTNDDGNPKSD